MLVLKFQENPTKSFGKEFIDYIAQNPVLFKMIFAPNNTGALRQKLSTMVAGVFLLIQSEKSTVDLQDDRLQYFSAFWASGCLAVIEKWVQTDFVQPKEFIVKTLSQLDAFLEKYIAAQLH